MRLLLPVLIGGMSGRHTMMSLKPAQGHDGDDDDREKISAAEIEQRPTGPEESWMMYNDAWVRAFERKFSSNNVDW